MSFKVRVFNKLEQLTVVLLENSESRPRDVLNNITIECLKAHAFCKLKANNTQVVITGEAVEFYSRQKACLDLNATFCKLFMKTGP